MAPGEPHNSEIADALDELGEMYELDGALVHRVRAYRTAAQSVRSATVSVAALAREGRATELPGIGPTIEGKILALIEKGAIPAAERLRERYPPGLIAITRLPGIGAKRARLLHDELGIDSPQALQEAAAAGRVRTVKGLGPKFEQHALAALRAGAAERPPARVLLPEALRIAEAIVAGLAACAATPADARIEIAGSIRRGGETVKDIDLIAVTEQPQALIDALATLPEIESVSSAGPTGARAATHTGLAIDLRVGSPELYGSLLQHFSGSAAHNAALREMAVKAGMHVSEYGVQVEATGESHACRTEREVYRLLGMEPIEPELREDRGELQAARLRDGGATLPKLIVQDDIRGDLHCHTTASDGRASIEEMAAAASALGYRYLAITDHSASHGFGNAVSPDALRRQIERIRELRESLAEITLLAGSEVNILPDGSLDYEDDLLAELDWVIASVHTAFGMPQREMTRRLIDAAEHPLVDAIGHPTGRLLLRREPYALDVEALIDAAARAGTMLEINANPDRRDLSEIHARAAAAAGVALVICSDAHRPEGLANMRWGIATARRGWLRREDVANTRTWPQLRRMRKRERGS